MNSKNKLAIVSGSGKNWKLQTPFGNFDRSNCGSFAHVIALARCKLAEFKAKGRKSDPAAYYVEGNHLFTFQGRFERSRPVYYCAR
jgi:hypothetical protein